LLRREWTQIHPRTTLLPGVSGVQPRSCVVLEGSEARQLAKMAWQPSDYEFQPFSLEVAKKAPGGSTDTNAKRKGGRQKRSSILCQVSSQFA
jgi:hypothetical protein